MELTPLEWEALRLSLRVAFVSMVVSLPPAILVAWLLARSRFPGKSLLDGLVHLPLILPPVATGYLLLLLFGNKGLIGRFLRDTLDIGVAFHWTGAALAAAVMGFPLMVRSIRLSIEGIDRRVEQAARTLGAGPIDTFATVTLPLMAPGVIAGLILSFAKGLGEFGATITFVSNIPGETRTLAIAIYTLLQIPGAEAAVYRLTALSVALSLAALVGSEVLARRAARRVRGEA